MRGEADVWCATPEPGRGWSPITALAELIGRLWQTTPRYLHPARNYGRLRKSAALLPRGRRGSRRLLLIAAQPGDLLALARPEVLAGRYGQIGAWIIDSFWSERIPRFARDRSTIDQLWVTDAELVGTYREATSTDCAWLPWGTDALRLASSPVPRDIDVLRLGRQPSALDDDRANERALRATGCSYQGRFPLTGDGIANQQRVAAYLARSKTVLASSSLVSRADYSHPTRDYISARFTDAAAAGTLIVGSRPRTRAADLIPRSAWYDIDLTDEATVLAQVCAAVSATGAARSARMQAGALEALDWRHRIKQVTERFGMSVPPLDDELRRVSALAQDLRDMAGGRDT